MKERINKVYFIKIKNSYSAKGTVKKMKRQATDYEKIFAKDTSAKGLLLKIQKELLKVNDNKKTNNVI